MKPLFQQVTIVGLGLIGGSLGMALRRKRLARRVVGVARRAATLREAKRLGAIDEGFLDGELLGCVEQSDLVVLTVLPKGVMALAKTIVERVKRPIVLTDAASTKFEIVRTVERWMDSRESPIRFVGGHPMAGSEQSGISAARRDLFENSVCVLTPTDRTPRGALSRVRSLWKGVGARIEERSPQRHDALVAEVSHVPHLGAVSLVEATSSEALKLVGSGFRDTTRIAQGDPVLWEEICRTNAKPIVKALDRWMAKLKGVRSLVEKRQSTALRRKLQAAQQKRQRLAR